MAVETHLTNDSNGVLVFEGLGARHQETVCVDMGDVKKESECKRRDSRRRWRGQHETQIGTQPLDEHDRRLQGPG